MDPSWSSTEVEILDGSERLSHHLMSKALQVSPGEKPRGEMFGTWGIPTCYFRGVLGGIPVVSKWTQNRGLYKSFQRNVLHECWAETFVRIVWEVMQHFFFWVLSLFWFCPESNQTPSCFLHGFMYTGNISALFQCPTNHGNANNTCQRLSTIQSTKD